MVGRLVLPEIPSTPIFDLYRELHFKGRDDRGLGVLDRRLERADQFLSDPTQLADAFRQSLEVTQTFFTANDVSDQPFFEEPDEATDDRALRDVAPGLASTSSLGKLFRTDPSVRWAVDDDALSFYYLEREIVVTRALGLRLQGGRSTKFGPRLDLLLTNARNGTPIIGEVKIAADKDPFFALVQGLACAAYLLPPNQLARIGHHDKGKRSDPTPGRVDIYVVLARTDARERSRPWTALRNHAERLSGKLISLLPSNLRTIAGLDLAETEGKLVVTKRFAYQR